MTIILSTRTITEMPISSTTAFQISGRIRTSKKVLSLPYSSSLHDDNDDDDGVFDFGTKQPTPPPHHQLPSSSRRKFLSLLTIAATATSPNIVPSLQSSSSSSSIANAAETIGKDPSCTSSSCLGVWDGLLADCPHDKNLLKGGAGCVSSQDDTPGIFAEPWDYSDTIPLLPSSSSTSPSAEDGEDGEEGGNAKNNANQQMNALILALQTSSEQRGDDVEILYQEGRYLRALFTDATSRETSVGEFYFTPDDTTVQFRINSTSKSLLLGRSSLSNNERAERLRKSLRYTKIPVLRNRKRTFFFAESDALDGFGPGSAMLGPPEEMDPGEIVLDGEVMTYGSRPKNGNGGASGVGRTTRGSEDVDPKLRIDWVESFPMGGSR
mmetsp:Transcript_32925/g.69050  ORF Transcript_32925/g.69050 Transcript_32925/m.69050 type:complete len:381 (-) Transcript_32925:556-1698(-)